MKHGLQAVVLADSIPQFRDDLAPSKDNRLITLEVTYWRGVHAEHLRHRMFSFSVASSRAIPTRRMLRQVVRHPYVPESFGRLIPGMQAGEPLGPVTQWVCRRAWLLARWPVLAVVLLLLLLKVHKQWCNRLLEPWLWVTCIVTGGIEAWEGFWKLRCHKDAEPHIRRMAEMTRDLVTASEPRVLKPGGIHSPMHNHNSDLDPLKAESMMISAGRCAAVSYDNHGKAIDSYRDIMRAQRMLAANPPHSSPFEHQAIVSLHIGFYPLLRGNLPAGWIQHRKIHDRLAGDVATVFCRIEMAQEEQKRSGDEWLNS